MLRLWEAARGALTGATDDALRAGGVLARSVLIRRPSRSTRLVFERIGAGFLHLRPCQGLLGLLAIGRDFTAMPDGEFSAWQAEAYLESSHGDAVRVEGVRALVRTSDGRILNIRFDRVLLPWRDRGEAFVMGVSLSRALTALPPESAADLVL